MRNQSLVLNLLAAASLVSLAACGSSEQAASENGADQTVRALGVSNTATYSDPNYREETREVPNEQGFSGSSQPSGLPPAYWTGTENFPPGANGAEAPGGQASGSNIGQAGD
jgi:hypothetical protein